MKAIKTAALMLGTFLLSDVSQASVENTCESATIFAATDVTTSDGRTFQTEAYFQGIDFSAIKFIRDGRSDSYVTVEGENGWFGALEEAQIGNRSRKDFARWHQFHAVLLHFDSLLKNTKTVSDVDFAGKTLDGRVGELPSGSKVYVLDDAGANRPYAIRYVLENDAVIDVKLEDWQTTGSQSLPHLLVIDNGTTQFNYRYTKIEIGAAKHDWFFNHVPVPSIETIASTRKTLQGCH